MSGGFRLPIYEMAEYSDDELKTIYSGLEKNKFLLDCIGQFWKYSRDVVMVLFGLGRNAEGRSFL